MRKAIAQSGAVISEYPPDEPPLRYNFPARNRIISALSDGLVVMEAGIKSGSLITARIAIDQGKEVFALLGNNSPQNEGSNKLIKEGLAHPVTDFMDILSEFNSNRGLYVENEKLDFDDISFSDLEAVPVKGKKPTNNKNTAKSKTTKAVKADVSEKKNEKSASNNNSKSAQHKENAQSAKKLEDKQENVQKNISDLKASGLSDTAINVYCQISNEPVHIDKIVSELNIPVFKVLTALTQLEIKGYVKAIQGRRYILK
jgi:DNA processing protein